MSRGVDQPSGWAAPLYTVGVFIWVFLYVAIALGGLVMVVCFGISLWRKSQALLDEVGVLLLRADEVAGLLGQIGVPTNFGGSQVGHGFGGHDVDGSYNRDVTLSPSRAT